MNLTESIQALEAKNIAIAINKERGMRVLHKCKCGFVCLHKVTMVRHLRRWLKIPHDQWLDESGYLVEHEEIQ